MTFPPPQERVLASGQLLNGPLAHRQLRSLQGEFQRAASHTSREEKTRSTNNPFSSALMSAAYFCPLIQRAKLDQIMQNKTLRVPFTRPHRCGPAVKFPSFSRRQSASITIKSLTLPELITPKLHDVRGFLHLIKFSPQQLLQICVTETKTEIKCFCTGSNACRNSKNSLS